MNEIHKPIRFFPIIGTVIMALGLFFFVLILALPQNSEMPLTAPTPATSTVPTTTRVVNVTDGMGQTVTDPFGQTVTTIITEPTSTSTTIDTTPVIVPIRFSYDIPIEFDGWTVKINNGRYDSQSKILSFCIEEMTTRVQARDISYTITINDSVQEYDTLPQMPPSIDEIYLELDHLINRSTRITIPNVEPDFYHVRIDMETYSVPDDSINGAGFYVYDTVYIEKAQLELR